MSPNADTSCFNGTQQHQQQQQQQQQHQQQQRRLRLRQLKKILPGDHVSVEKNFPRFYEKCKNLKLLRELQDLQEDQRVSQWAAVEKSFTQRSQSKMADGAGGNKMAAGAPDLTMADHLEEMTLHRGCWLQAKLSFHQNRLREDDSEIPRVVFVHRKKSPTEIRTRSELAREVLAQFEREKRNVENIQNSAPFLCPVNWKINFDNLCRRVS